MKRFNLSIIIGLICILVIPNAVICLASEKNPHQKISARLKNLIHKEKSAPPLANRIRVIFNIQKDIVNLDDIKLEGAEVLVAKDNLVAAEVPLDKVEDIVDNVNGIEYARLPQKFFSCAVTSEGVSLTQTNVLHTAGFKGEGVKVAVIDVGFKGLSQAQTNGDLPDDVITHDFTGTGLQTQYKHGTACAEIVYDMAPDAELHLLKISDEIDIYDAFDYCVDNDINIVSASIGTFGTGPGNGTGPVDEACDEVQANGILVVSAAGNEANFTLSDGTPCGTHWEGTFVDANSDKWHEFILGASRSSYNLIYAEPATDDDDNSETGEVTIVMRWDDWPNAAVDYDMYLYDDSTGSLVASSTDIQNGSQPPIEYIAVDLPDSQLYGIYK